MRGLKLTVAYCGAAYCGWQVQTGQDSIQQKLQEAFEAVTGERVQITGSGRTDAGVHALGQVASLRTRTTLECERLLRALNATTPEDIAILKIEETDPEFHAIRDATGKRYRYRIQPGRIRDPLDRGFSWFVPTELDVAAMREACRQLVGEHDFACFQAAGGVRKTTVRRIFECTLERQLDGPFEKLIFEIEGNGFLYNMVRNIVGSLVEIGKRKRSPAWIGELIAGRNRTLAGPTAPAHALFLVHVRYDPADLAAESVPDVPCDEAKDRRPAR